MDSYEDVLNVCIQAKQNENAIVRTTLAQKNKMLEVIVKALKDNKKSILEKNAIDVEATVKKGKPAHFIDRLTLNEKRIDAIAEGVLQLIKLDDPSGKVLESWQVQNGLQIEKITVPFGVVAIIYEARPNVTLDCISLCIKSGNACVLRGSSETINTNIEIVSVVKTELKKAGFNSEFIQLIEDTTHEGANFMLKQKKYIDLIIPRGSASLIQSVLQNSEIPVIETGTGNCHTYVEETADFNMAVDIIVNAKMTKASACNSCESVIVDKKIASNFLPLLEKALTENKVEIRGCDEACKFMKTAKHAIEQDFETEYLDYILSIKVVDDVEDAILHINKYSTRHSDCIVSKNNDAIQKFLSGVDSACVYANASTRFSDGFEFGFGAEIGISNQKLHARGPMGLKELNTYKYMIKGNGQVRK